MPYHEKTTEHVYRVLRSHLSESQVTSVLKALADTEEGDKWTADDVGLFKGLWAMHEKWLDRSKKRSM